MAKRSAAKKAPTKRKKRTALTKQEEAFCQHFALHKVGSDAVRHAYPGWKAKQAQDAARKANKLLARGEIKGRIEALATRVAEIAEQKFEITAERVLEEFAAIAFYKADDYFEWGTNEVPQFHKNGDPILDRDGNQVVAYVPWVRCKDSRSLTPDQMRAVLAASMTISKTGEPVLEVKMADRVTALKALGQHLGLFKSIVQAEGKGGGPIQIIVSNAEANL